jgi:hypothetical protein
VHEERIAASGLVAGGGELLLHGAIQARCEQSVDPVPGERPGLQGAGGRLGGKYADQCRRTWNVVGPRGDHHAHG